MNDCRKAFPPPDKAKENSCKNGSYGCYFFRSGLCVLHGVIIVGANPQSNDLYIDKLTTKSKRDSLKTYLGECNFFEDPQQ